MKHVIAYICVFLGPFPVFGQTDFVTACTDLKGQVYTISGDWVDEEDKGWASDRFIDHIVLLKRTQDGFVLFYKNKFTSQGRVELTRLSGHVIS